MKLICFGDSHTVDFENNRIPPYKEYKKWCNDKFPKSWPTLLSEKLNIELKNYGHGGSCNDIIFETFVSKLDEIKKDDIVIIGWTFLFRFKWFNEKFNFFDTILSNEHDENIKNISKQTATEILINRSNKSWGEDIMLKKKLIIKLSELIGFKIYFWSVDEFIQHSYDEIHLCCNLLNNENNMLKYIKNSGGKTIHDETNGLINDFHLGESGHIVQSELFFEHIKNYKNIKKFI